MSLMVEVYLHIKSQDLSLIQTLLMLIATQRIAKICGIYCTKELHYTLNECSFYVTQMNFAFWLDCLVMIATVYETGTNTLLAFP